MPKRRAQASVQEQMRAINPVLANPKEFRASLKRHSARSTTMPGFARMYSRNGESTTFLLAASEEAFLNHTCPSWRTTIPTCETSSPSSGE
ncbi:Uncharacterised protein [Salmonella enterica subsp. arizonae]|nr:Uncharacterised protein [Salmonella enterica subsp. arizonae]